jgi:cytochrome c2
MHRRAAFHARARAETAARFERCPYALRGACIVWERDTLGAWLCDPQALGPGRTMALRGVPDAALRADHATVVISGPEELSAFVRRHCP